jgi:hypothetical protein
LPAACSQHLFIKAAWSASPTGLAASNPSGTLPTILQTSFNTPTPLFHLPHPAAILISQYVLLGTGGAQAGGVVLDQRGIVGIYIGVEILIGLLNTFSTRLLDTVGEVSGKRARRAGTAAAALWARAVAARRCRRVGGGAGSGSPRACRKVARGDPGWPRAAPRRFAQCGSTSWA